MHDKRQEWLVEDVNETYCTRLAPDRREGLHESDPDDELREQIRGRSTVRAVPEEGTTLYNWTGARADLRSVGCLHEREVNGCAVGRRGVDKGQAHSPDQLSRQKTLPLLVLLEAVRSAAVPSSSTQLSSSRSASATLLGPEGLDNISIRADQVTT